MTSDTLLMASTHFWLRLSIWFLGLWGCGYAVSIAWRRRRERGLTTLIDTRGERLKEAARLMILNAGKIGLGVALGVMGTDWWQVHHLGEVSLAVVEQQRGTYVSYHYLGESEPRTHYAFNFCPGRYLPQFEPRQIIRKMRYVRVVQPDGRQCEDLTPPAAYLQLWRKNGVPILEEGGE